MNFAELGKLDFEAPDLGKFPSLRLAREAGERSGTMPAVMNAANEVAVDAFLAGGLGFTRIAELVETVMERHAMVAGPGLDDLLAADAEARRVAGELVG